MSRQLTQITDCSERSCDAPLQNGVGDALVAKRGSRGEAVGKSATRASRPLHGDGASPLRSSVRVALLDGDTAMQATLRSHLANEPDWQLDLHTHGEPAWRALRATPPQVVLLERNLPDGCGINWLRRCKREFPELPVVILATQGCVKSLWAALQAGAHGYWVKGGDRDEVVKELVQQVRKVLSGKLALCDQAERLLPQALALMQQRTVNQWGLSRREEEIMQSLCEQNTDKEIATGLGISDETVHVHLRNAFKKLGVHDRKAAAAKFLKVFPAGG